MRIGSENDEIRLQGPLAGGKRNIHILRYKEAILAFTYFNLNLMLTKIACLWLINRTLYISLIITEKGTLTRSKECSC